MATGSPRAEPGGLVEDRAFGGPFVDRLFLLVALLVPFVLVVDLLPAEVRLVYVGVLTLACTGLVVYGLRDAYHWATRR